MLNMVKLYQKTIKNTNQMPFLTRKIRVSIMCLLILCFFVVAPVILFYTAGYRYDFSKRHILQTGVLNIDAEPADATIQLNGIEQKNKLPLYLPNRAPGTYKLTISKRGYKTWEKDITIDSNKTTYIKNVKLFKDSLPTKLLDDSKIIDISPSFNGSYIVLLTQESNNSKTIDLYDNRSAGRQTIWRANTNKKPNIDWSPYGDWFVLQESQTIQLVDATNSSISNSISVSSSIQEWHWSLNSSAIFIQQENDIKRMDINGKQIYSISSTSVWYADDNVNWQYDAVNKCLKPLLGDKVDCVYNMPHQIDSIVFADQNRFILKSTEGLLIARIENRELKEIKNLANVNNLLYNQQTREWLAWSPWELWTIYGNGTASLLNRTSDEIRFVCPLDENGLLLLASNDKITAFNPGYYVTHELFSGGKIERVNANIDLRKIYFLGEVGQKRGVFELEY